MSIGTGIVLIVIGAIVTWAIAVDTWGPVNVDLIGYILMFGGLVTLIVGLAAMFRRRQSMTTVRGGVDANGAQVSQRETTSNDGPTVL